MLDLETRMHKLARAAFESDPADYVAVLREVLTEVWQDGFGAGHAAAHWDEQLVRHIESTTAKAKDGDDDDS